MNGLAQYSYAILLQCHQQGCCNSYGILLELEQEEDVTGFLKNKMKFRGFVISDWQGIDRVTTPPHANYSFSVEAGVDTGIDMVLVPYNFTEFIDDRTYQVKNKIIPMSRIVDAVKRVLRVKFVMGLFEKPLADFSWANQLGNQSFGLQRLLRDFTCSCNVVKFGYVSQSITVNVFQVVENVKGRGPRPIYHLRIYSNFSNRL